MRKIWKKVKDLLISITFSKPKEFDRLQRTQKEVAEKKNLKDSSKRSVLKQKNKSEKP
ncbi:MAG: hypothetical protein NZ809_05360 [Thermodesulfovibrio sp.]|nr:hypothetical protein [Thermodesulfovibrio sp.]